jgi:hypothetical protein
MKRWLPLFLIALMSIVAGFVLGVARRSITVEPTLAVQTSFAVDDDLTTKFLQARIKSIEWPDHDGVVARYRTNGATTTANQNITLIGRTPRSDLDEHGKTTLAVIGVEGGKATVSVLSEFDHRSFGKNLITVDSRIVTVDVTPSSP